LIGDNMRKELCLTALFATMTTTAHAQNGVALFGILDAGVTYVSNEGGHANVKFDDGIYAPNLIGLRGIEDLGGGIYALFELSSQFSLGNGEFFGNGMFGRTSFVGLRDDRVGTVTLGDQYDFMPEVLFFGGDDAARDVVGLYNFRNGPFQKVALPNNPTGAFDWDRLGTTQRVPSAVKYVSPSVGGVTFGAMYGFRDSNSSTGLDNTQSFGLSYAAGSFGAGAAYTNQRYLSVGGSPASTVTNWGAGAHYAANSLTTTVLFTTVRSSASGGAVWMTEVGGTWHFTRALMLGVDYMYMKGNAQVNDSHAHQIDASLQYALSRRTSVYVSGVYQRANSGAHAQINGVLDTDGASSGATQTITRIAIHTVF
jgi:predicted porin